MRNVITEETHSVSIKGLPTQLCSSLDPNFVTVLFKIHIKDPLLVKSVSF